MIIKEKQNTHIHTINILYTIQDVTNYKHFDLLKLLYHLLEVVSYLRLFHKHSGSQIVQHCKDQ